MTIRNLLVLLVALWLTACASSPEGIDSDNKDAAQLYKEAKEHLELANYEEAIKLYEKLESQYPYGNYATRSQLEIAYAYYKFDEGEAAILAADRFIKLHPGHPHADYAYYLRGLASYNAAQNTFQKLFNQDPAERDPKEARRSFHYFAELVKTFPKSRYLKDAIQRMTQIRNNLAKYEIYVASYYFKRGAYLAAANRAKYVIENYQQAPAQPDALVIMVESYRELKLPDLANDSLRVLEANHPDHPELQSLRKSLQGKNS